MAREGEVNSWTLDLSQALSRGGFLGFLLSCKIPTDSLPFCQVILSAGKVGSHIVLLGNLGSSVS